MNWRNILSRAAWTAAQAFLAAISVEELLTSLPVEWKVIVTATLATALSFLKTLVAEKLNPTV